MLERYAILDEVSEEELKELEISYNWCGGNTCGQGSS